MFESKIRVPMFVSGRDIVLVTGASVDFYTVDLENLEIEYKGRYETVGIEDATLSPSGRTLGLLTAEPPEANGVDPRYFLEFLDVESGDRREYYPVRYTHSISLISDELVVAYQDLGRGMVDPDWRLVFLDVEEGHVSHEIRRRQEETVSLAVHPNGRIVALARDDGAIDLLALEE